MIEIKNIWPYEAKDGKKFDDLEVGYAVAKLIRNQKELTEEIKELKRQLLRLTVDNNL
jgi:hypothetical protein